MKKEELLKMISEGDVDDAIYFLNDLENNDDINEVRMEIVDELSGCIFDLLDLEIFLSHCIKIQDAEKKVKFIKDSILRIYDFDNFNEISEVIFKFVDNGKLMLNVFKDMLILELNESTEKQHPDIYKKYIVVIKNKFDNSYKQIFFKEIKERMALRLFSGGITDTTTRSEILNSME